MTIGSGASLNRRIASIRAICYVSRLGQGVPRAYIPIIQDEVFRAASRFSSSSSYHNLMLRYEIWIFNTVVGLSVDYADDSPC